VTAVDPAGGMSIPVLAGMHRALRGRVLHRWALDLGSGGSELSSAHVAALEALVCRWRGQGPVALPGGIRVARVAGRLVADRPVSSRGPAHDVARSAE
jgi:tRNA(Ile)-lysidine synthase